VEPRPPYISDEGKTKPRLLQRETIRSIRVSTFFATYLSWIPFCPTSAFGSL
jgi:hypothetical protein